MNIGATTDRNSDNANTSYTITHTGQLATVTVTDGPCYGGWPLRLCRGLCKCNVRSASVFTDADLPSNGC